MLTLVLNKSESECLGVQGQGGVEERGSERARARGEGGAQAQSRTHTRLDALGRSLGPRDAARRRVIDMTIPYEYHVRRSFVNQGKRSRLLSNNLRTTIPISMTRVYHLHVL